MEASASSASMVVTPLKLLAIVVKKETRTLLEVQVATFKHIINHGFSD